MKTLARIASILLIAAPPAAAPLYVARAARARAVARRAWLWPFGGYAALMGAYGLFVGASADVAREALASVGLMLAAILVVPDRREGVVGLAIGGVLLVAMIPLQGWTNERSWRAYSDATVHTIGLWSGGPVQRIANPEGGPAAWRSYLLRDDGNHAFSLEIRRMPSWPWRGADALVGEDLAATVDLDLGSEAGMVPVRKRIALDDEWSRVTLTLDEAVIGDGGSPQETTARSPDAPTVDRAFAIVRLYLPPGTPVAVRGVTAAATTAGAASPRPAIGEWRPTLFHGARNFLGHSAAVAALVVLAVARSGTGRLLGAAPFLAIAALTGSRSAWLGVFVGAVILAIPRVRRTTGGRSFGWGVMPFVALVGLVGTWAVRSSLLEHQTSRLDIFAGAVQAFLDDPWRGLAGRGIDFADYWQTLARDPGGEAVTHAHNLWLQAAAMHGVIGLTATTWLSLAFMILAWRLGRLAGVALVLGALTMSVLDVSFLFVYVQLPLMWGLNALDAASRSLQGGQQDVPPPRSP